MKASVIIPTYQRPQFVWDALASVRNQNIDSGEYEILVVDNALQPTSELAELCDTPTEPPVCFIHEPRNGLHNARHAGARVAKGEILVYIDDDVLCPRGWLAAMVAPYLDSRVAMVAGKVILRYEVEPPPWLDQFRGILSALDWGDTPRAAAPYGSPVGCNMSVRRSVLFDLGGFNPDSFGDRSLIHLRGDGECGLARKVHDAGWTVWYTPDAWLEHRVPAKRMTQEYIEWRSIVGGIEDAYIDLRYRWRTVPGLLLCSGRSALYSLYHRVHAYWRRREDGTRMRHVAVAKRYEYRAIQGVKQANSKGLRHHASRLDYME